MSSEPAAKCLSPASKGFSADLDVRALELVDEREQRDLAGVGDGNDASRCRSTLPAREAGSSSGVMVAFRIPHVGDADDLDVEELG